MKHRNLVINISVLLILLSNILNAQQQYDPTSITQEIDYKIDELGDARLEFRQKMTASQWLDFKAGAIAKNPSIFRRDLERSMTNVLLEDFKNELNEENRSSITQITARNVATYKGNGKWEFKLGTKEPNVTKISDHIYLLTGNLASGNGIIQQLQKISFPERAYNIKQDTDVYDNAIFTYMLDVEESSINLLLILGIVLSLTGVVCLFVQRMKTINPVKI